MNKATKKTFALVGGGAVVGIILGSAFKRCPAIAPAARGEPDIPALQRIAGDIVNMCDMIRGPALQLEEALADDGEISTAEAYALYQQFQRLT